MTEYSRHILQRVATFIEQNHLLDANVRTLYVGLSGGPDSVALLHILGTTLHSKLSTPHYTITALHCNFHLRGDESDRDQHFCEQLCHDLGIKLRVKEFETRAYMQAYHLSLEMAARELRYDWWNTILNSQTIQTPLNSKLSSPNSRIALGHHQDDSIETLLMNLMRGTGLQGLTGIVPYNAEKQVIRPLLCLSRQEILDYLADNDLGYVTDSTNFENDTLRNQVRNHLLPLMEQLLPQARQGIVTTIQNLQPEAELSQRAIEQYVEQQATAHTADGYTYYVLSSPCPYHFHVQRHFARMGYRVVGDVATPIQQSVPEHPLPDETLSETFDRDQLHLPLRWRRWQQGDRMAPLGMDGHTKLVSDLFTNAHYLPIEKQMAWVLEDAQGQILWIPRLRMSHLARVTDQTRHTITIFYGQKF